MEFASKPLIEACIRRIDADLNLLSIAKGNVERYPQSVSHIQLQWRKLLQLPWTELRALLREGGDKGDLVRQNAPFAGILPAEERALILKEAHAASRSGARA